MKETIFYSRAEFQVANAVWPRFGVIGNYIDALGGGAPALFGRPVVTGTEILNDISGHVTNFYRAVQRDPQAVAAHAGWPINDVDLVARHHWLVSRCPQLMARLHQRHPRWSNARIAGWWVWGMLHWGGPGWCSGAGRWSVAGGSVVTRPRVAACPVRLPNLAGGQEIQEGRSYLTALMSQLSRRLEGVCITCGDWRRVVAPQLLTEHTGVFLDPPYLRRRRYEGAGSLDTPDSRDCRLWAVANGEKVKIALCGFESDPGMPARWDPYRLEPRGGSATVARRSDRPREVIWFSPKCSGGQLGLFEDAAPAAPARPPEAEAGQP